MNNYCNRMTSINLMKIKLIIAAVFVVPLIFFSYTGLMAACVKGNCSNGIGTCRYSNGDVYTGPFKDGRPHGKGFCRFTSGEEYSGNFEKGRINGEGKYTFINGDRFSGTFKNGGMLNGTLYFRNGEKYSGWFYNGEKNGRGIYYYKDGFRFEGQWENDLRDGPGILYRGNTVIKNGTWKKGKFLKG
jgi:hypothetical protein